MKPNVDTLFFLLTVVFLFTYPASAASPQASTSVSKRRAFRPLAIALECNGPLPPLAVSHDHNGQFHTLAAFCASSGPLCRCSPRYDPGPFDLVCFEEVDPQPGVSFDEAIDYCLALCWCQEPNGRRWYPPEEPQPPGPPQLQGLGAAAHHSQALNRHNGPGVGAPAGTTS
ncbi:hypothetical protein MMC16_005214 [Acarospora aff. strigata]|nr:hypothetical protein [Acarospora aff. strigata]